jgi:hypothetical protein
MAKYRITEEQLQKVFESLEMKKMTEMDNYNYPAGSDTPDAPWNEKEPKKTKAIVNKGALKLVLTASGEYLIFNENTKQLIYTMDEVWENQDGRSWGDIKDALYDFLEIPQERGEDMDNWKDYIDSDDVANALVSYTNHQTAKGGLDIVDLDRWESGDGRFLLITPENIDEIYNEDLKQKAKEIFGVN